MRVLDQSGVLREAMVDTPGFTYGAAMQAQDGAGTGLAVEVAQVSDIYGPGLFARWAG